MKRDVGSHLKLNLDSISNMRPKSKTIHLNSSAPLTPIPTCTGMTPPWYCLHLAQEWTLGPLDYQAINKGKGQKSPRCVRTHFTAASGVFHWYEKSPLMALALSHLKVQTSLKADLLVKKVRTQAHDFMEKRPLPQLPPLSPYKARAIRQKLVLKKNYQHWKDPTALISPITPLPPFHEIHPRNLPFGKITRDNWLLYRQLHSKWPATNSTLHAVCYEVRVDAWSCSCPAFAFSAFPAAASERTDDESDDITQQQTYRSNTETWIFGGLTLGSDMPICKHLLAGVLVERCSIFATFVEEREVSVEELAAWAAGWGESVINAREAHIKENTEAFV
ncbi:hypothetical protein LTR37_015424 [Vermiconidia calcicola]|uniref:Uncharacterized protein n=1 Tax=Vermiconidia calcicola TaxID=1690605 RepID=A0ACC3MRY0_9PEZI|nr:hypothetical protein LTR37_015424 [Vermiconidia calcicola]